VPGEVIVGFEQVSISAGTKAAEHLGGQIIKQISVLNAVVVKVQGNEDDFIKNISKISGVRFAERNGIGEAAFTPDDTYWSRLWNMRIIKADVAWDTYRGSIGMGKVFVIAILDTGVDYMHHDLAANYMSGGYDWANNDWDPMDDNSHGTHCAGIAAAVMNNALGVAGVAQCKIWAEKILDSGGYGDVADLASGIVHAATHGVDIISMSLQHYPYSTLVENAVNFAYNNGVLLVGAAGNDHKNIDTDPSYPASYTNVMAVSATKNDDTFDSSYSNYGNKIEVSAPGTNVYSTVLSDGYSYKTGTSMACPLVAGFASLLWSYKPFLTNTQVRAALQAAVDDKGTPGKDIYYGYGRINCLKAISSPEKWQYGFRLAPYADQVWMNAASQPGGILINGKVNLTSPFPVYPAPVLGWASGDNIEMAIDWRTVPGSYEFGLLAGKISTGTGTLYRTQDGTSWTSVSVTFAPLTAKSVGDESVGSVSAAMGGTAAIQYVEGLNPTQPVGSLTTPVQEIAIRYVPTVSYQLKKVELMTGLVKGPVTIQLRPDNGIGGPSNTVLRQVTFTMSSTVSWQGAEFATSYPVAAGTPYWIVYNVLPGQRSPVATTGTPVTAAWDYYSTGYGWDGQITMYPCMAKFYREVQPNFQYHYTVSPFNFQYYINIISQPAGMLIYGVANVTLNHPAFPAPILGWIIGNGFFMPFDFRTSPASSDLGFIVGTISPTTGKIYATYDGTAWSGPATVNLVSFG
jgi:thermitase